MGTKVFLIDSNPAVRARMIEACDGLGALEGLSPEEVHARSGGPQAGDRAVVCLGPSVGADDSLAGFVAGFLVGAPRVTVAAGANAQLDTARLRRDVERTLAGLDQLERKRSALDLLFDCLRAERPLQEIADVAVEALSGVLGDCPVLVQVFDDGRRVTDRSFEGGGAGAPWIEAGRGGEMSTDLFNRELNDGVRALGEIVVDFAGGELTAAEVRDLVEQVAVPVELAVAARLRERESQRAVHSTLVALAELAGAREHGGGQHVERIVEYVRVLARGLRAQGYFVGQLTDEAIDDISQAVPLHDIGKLAIPDAILLKTSALSDAEWSVVKTHAQVGCEVLDSALEGGDPPRFLQLARDAAWCHHERWDGSGYPRGLAGEHIPLVARLLAVAGLYDAVTSQRPYRAARSHSEAMELLAQLAGSHLDPRMVDCFLAHATEVDRIRDEMGTAVARAAEVALVR